MNFRASRNFRATRNSTIIAVIFTIVSGASTLAGGDLPGINGDNSIGQGYSWEWPAAEEKQEKTSLLCAI